MSTHVVPFPYTSRLGWLAWLDSDFFKKQTPEEVAAGPQIDVWHRYIPFVFMHVGCLAAFWVGVSPAALWLALGLYIIRMFFITGFYHRFFSHRTFQTSRWFQFVMAFLGGTAVQRGAVWWASNHRHHHKASDQPDDLHSPKQRGFWWAHMGWLACSANMPTNYKRVPDLAKYPELVWLNRFDWVPPITFAVLLYIVGSFAPAAWNTSGPQFLVWGFFISTSILFHGTWTINSLSHQFGTRRYDTTDTSRNNWLLALITLGEGWHNNHHKYQGTVRQGFYWWEIDVAFYGIWLLSKLGLVWDLHPVPKAAYESQQ